MGAGEGGGSDGLQQDQAQFQEDLAHVLAARAEATEPASGPAQPATDDPQADYTGGPQGSIEAPRPAEYYSQEPGNWSNEGRSTGEDSAAQRMDYALGGDNAQLNTAGTRRRTPRQQEQNKHAQQRYRARRKAQFEELQETVSMLTSQLRSLENERQRRQELEMELVHLRAHAGGAGPSLSPHNSRPPLGLNLQTAPQLDPSNPLQTLLQALTAHGALPHAEPPPPLPPQPSTPAEPPVIPLAQIQSMLRAFGQELWSFMSTHSMAQVQHTPEEVSDNDLLQMTQMVKMGIELANLVLNATGTDAEVLIHDGAQPGLPCAADDARRWKAVAAAVALTPSQGARVALWRANFLSQLDACYGRRVALKAQALQAMDLAQGAETQWAEGLLLQAAGTSGFALPAQADAELLTTADDVKQNVVESRSAAMAALSELLLSILTPAQAVRYLATSHPFSWNALAFSQAAVAIHNQPPSGPSN